MKVITVQVKHDRRHAIEVYGHSIVKQIEITQQDAEQMKNAMKQYGIKGTVRKGTGSCRYWLYVTTNNESIISIAKKMGYELVFMPNKQERYYTFRRKPEVLQTFPEDTLIKLVR